MSDLIDKQKLADLGSLEFMAKQVVEGFITGLHKSPFHGFSVEFAEHRLYNNGESTRHIDWKLLARTDKIFTKKYEEETNLRCQIVIDASSSMWFPEDRAENKIRFSIYAAASLIELLKKQRDAVGLTIISEELDLHTQAKSSFTHHRLLYAELEKLLINYADKKKKTTHFIEHIHDVAQLCHKRSLVILFTDLLGDVKQTEELFQAIQHLKHNQHEVLLFHVFDQKLEIDFELENRPYTIVDMETGERIKIHSNELKEKYHAQINHYFDEIALKCKNHRVDFIQADINKGYQQVLVNYLIKRKKMG
jgi:uncharacterized protein (DUF58 family)